VFNTSEEKPNKVEGVKVVNYVDYKRVAERLAEMVYTTASNALNQEGICYNHGCPFGPECGDKCFEDDFAEKLIQKIAEEEG
jgi:hypothetical protein